MGNSFNDPGDYRIEISGWGLDNSFFVERTDLLWTSEGGKQVQLRRALREGTVVFIRLLASEQANDSVPIAYEVREVVPMDRNGRCQIQLERLHPRGKESSERKSASKLSEDAKRERNVHEEVHGVVIGQQQEEVLR